MTTSSLCLCGLRHTDERLRGCSPSSVRTMVPGVVQKIKKDLSVRTFEIDGHKVQRDLYSAFITGHTIYSSEDSEFPDSVDFESCLSDFENYLFLQNKELERLSKETQLSWYIS